MPASVAGPRGPAAGPTTADQERALSTPQPLDTIARQVRVEQEVTRSRFIATLAPVGDEAAAEALIDRVRGRFHDARHHCTALILGPDGQRRRSNDDGEPGGTAGAPMLAALTGAGLTDVVAVVTRYFGGTLLGAGGLVRAYGGAVAAAVDAADRLRQVPVTRVRVEVGHATAGRIEHQLHHLAGALDLEVAAGEYGARGAAFTVSVPVAVGVDAVVAGLGSDAAEVELTELGTALRAVRITG